MGNEINFKGTYTTLCWITQSESDMLLVLGKIGNQPEQIFHLLGVTEEMMNDLKESYQKTKLNNSGKEISDTLCLWTGTDPGGSMWGSYGRSKVREIHTGVYIQLLVTGE